MTRNTTSLFDGRRWKEAQAPASTATIWEVVHGGGRFYAARSYSGRTDLLVSSDGKTWTAVAGKLVDEEGTLPNFMGLAWAEVE